MKLLRAEKGGGDKRAEGLPTCPPPPIWKVSHLLTTGQKHTITDSILFQGKCEKKILSSSGRCVCKHIDYKNFIREHYSKQHSNILNKKRKV